MNEKCKCGHEEENHYLGTEGCAICYKVDKYLCTKYESLNHIPDVGQKEETKEIDDFDTLIRDITSVGFMAKSEARERMNKILDKARTVERLEAYKDIINKLYNTKDYNNALHNLEFWLNETINQMEKYNEQKDE